MHSIETGNKLQKREAAEDGANLTPIKETGRNTMKNS